MRLLLAPLQFCGCGPVSCACLFSFRPFRPKLPAGTGYALCKSYGALKHRTRLSSAPNFQLDSRRNNQCDDHHSHELQNPVEPKAESSLAGLYQGEPCQKKHEHFKILAAKS